MKSLIKKNKNTTKKASVDFDADSIRIMDELKDRYKARSYSAIVNMMLHTFGELNTSVREELVRFCKLQSAKEFKFGSDNAYNLADILECKGQYQNIIDFLTIGKLLNVEEVKKMKKCFIYNGYCIVPVDWIEVTFDRAEDSEYVGVVEVRNGAKYNIPHFYFFSQKPIRFLTNKERDAIEDACARKSIEFRNAMRYRVEAVEGADGLIANEKEWLAAPECGIFQMGVHGDRESFPYGAMIYQVDDIAYSDEKTETDEDEFFDDEEYYEDTDDGEDYIKL